MKDILTIIKFTMKDMIHRKSFIISTIIILFLIIVGFNVPNIIKSFDSGEESKMIISDPNNIYNGELEKVFPKCEKDSNCVSVGYDIEVTKDSIEDLKKKVSDEEIDSAIYIESDGVTYNGLKYTYIVKNAMYVTSIPESVYNQLTMYYQAMEISKLNLSDEDLAKIHPNYQVEMEQVEEEVKGNVLAMMLMSIVLFYAIYFCAYQVSSSITTEKTSKIIETLVTSTSPKNIVIGKTIGIGIVGLLQVLLYLITAIICAKLFVEKELIESILDLSTITFSLGLITILYFILGYFTFALLYALTGSTVSKPEDIQSANTPVALITLVGFYLSYFTMMNPNSNLNYLASMIPISSPFCMPFRIMMGFASSSEVLLSILILIATIVIIANITIRVYSNAIINYGSKMSFKDIINMYKQK